MTVLVEHGLHGGSASAPIAAKILNKYFEDKYKGQEGVAAEKSGNRRVILSQEMIEETDPTSAEDLEEGENDSPQPNQPAN